MGGDSDPGTGWGRLFKGGDIGVLPVEQDSGNIGAQGRSLIFLECQFLFQVLY